MIVDKLRMDTIFNHSRCMDLFYNCIVDGNRLYEPMHHRKRIQLKIKRNEIKRQIVKLQLIKSLGAVDKILLIRTIIKMIELEKQIFVMDVEQG